MFAEFDKVIHCLALEIPGPVHAYVFAQYGKLKLEVEKFTTTNSIKAEIAVLRDEVAEMSHAVYMSKGGYILKRLRQLSAV